MNDVKIKGDVLNKALRDVLENAKVPAIQHLELIKTLHERIAAHDKTNETLKNLIADHQKKTEDHDRLLVSREEFLKKRDEEHSQQLSGYDEELQRHKTLAKGEKGDDGEDGEDGISPAIGDIVSAILPLLPEPEKGKDGVSIDEDTVVSKLITKIQKEKPIDISHIRNATGFMKDGIKYKFEELMKGGGNSSSSGTGFQVPTGTVNGVNTVFTFTTAPNAIVVDGGRAMQKVSSDGSVNWTGTLVITLTIAPVFDIFGVA